MHDSLHPSIFPPATPNPTPYTGDDDRRYVRSEGTVLVAKIWGQDASDDPCEAFSLLWSEKEQVWVAVYRLGITVCKTSFQPTSSLPDPHTLAFLRLNIHNPLLCLTVSSTLREKPISWARQGHPLAPFMSVHGVSQDSEAIPSPLKTDTSAPEHDEGSEELNGLEEVNLLEGLGSGKIASNIAFASHPMLIRSLLGPTFAITGPDRVYLPTTRLGSVTRRKLFSLPPVVPALASAPSPATSTARLTHATLRKSFRKTLQTISGFRVRMRTVFVPYVLLPADGPGIGQSDGDEDGEDERERREAGSDEHTVVLCVEIENSGESGRRVGFSVDAVDVQIGGEGAKAILIGWQERMGSKHGAFPLVISATEQYNLLYAVSFLRAPGDVDGFSLTSTTGDATNVDMQRAVTINIFGRPFLLSEQLSISEAHKLITEQGDMSEACKAGTVSFPTQVFSSRWNCVLDLSSNQTSGYHIRAGRRRKRPGRAQRPQQRPTRTCLPISDLQSPHGIDDGLQCVPAHASLSRRRPTAAHPPRIALPQVVCAVVHADDVPSGPTTHVLSREREAHRGEQTRHYGARAVPDDTNDVRTATCLVRIRRVLR